MTKINRQTDATVIAATGLDGKPLLIYTKNNAGNPVSPLAIEISCTATRPIEGAKTGHAQTMVALWDRNNGVNLGEHPVRETAEEIRGLFRMAKATEPVLQRPVGPREVIFNKFTQVCGLV